MINFIYDKNLMEKSVVASGYDPTKLPLGKLSDDTIKEGYKYLCQIEAILKAAKSLTPSQKDLVSALSSKFYTFIPHNYGRDNMSKHIIDNMDKLK